VDRIEIGSLLAAAKAKGTCAIIHIVESNLARVWE
jgi:hypothetical protein